MHEDCDMSQVLCSMFRWSELINDGLSSSFLVIFAFAAVLLASSEIGSVILTLTLYILYSGKIVVGATLC